VHNLWTTALPRLIAASYWIGLVMALIIRAAFRPGQSHLSWRRPAARARQRLK